MTEVTVATTAIGPPGSATIQGLCKPFAGLSVLLPFAVVIAIWWAIKAGGGLDDRVLASPVQVAQAGWTLVTHGILAEYAATSLRMIGLAALVSLLRRRPARLPDRLQPRRRPRARGHAALPARRLRRRVAAARDHLVRLHATRPSWWS